jgi:phosphatidylcholine synthase
MKTKDKSFSGFPSCWNMVVLVMFAVSPGFWTILAIVTVLAVLMFVPVKFVHPVRTRRWRRTTLPMAIVWTACAGWAAAADFDTPATVQLALIVTSLYLLVAGGLQQVLYRTDG